jgi:hypothetical protein
MKRILFTLLATALIVEILLVVSERSVLVWQDTVQPGETYTLEGYGNLGNSKQTTLACYYFTGFGVVGVAKWYSPNNFLGVRRCQFLD